MTHLFRPDPDAVPAELRALHQWVRWKYVRQPGVARPRKIPVYPDRDCHASSTDPRTWGSFATCLENVGRHDTVGVGFVLTAGDPYVGIDLDHVLRAGALLPAVAPIVEDLASYSEVSPSGEGVRIIVRGTVPEIRHRTELGDGAELEIYSHSRYLTITGNALRGSVEEIQDATEALARIVDRYEMHASTSPEGAGGVVPPPCAVPLAERRFRAERYVARIPPAVSGNGGSNVTFLLAQRLVRGFVLEEPDALALLEPWNRRCVPPWDPPDLARKVHEAAAKGRLPWACMYGSEPEAAATAAATPALRLVSADAIPAERPPILVEGGRLHLSTDEAEAVLADDGDTYQRGGMLVRAVRSPKTDMRHFARREGTLVIVPLDAAYLSGKLTSLVSFERHDARSGRTKRIDCPSQIADLILARRGDWSLPILTGVTESPVMRPDGSLLTTPGYDTATGLLFDPGSTMFPAIPDQPSLLDAKRAVDTLAEPLREFPWRGDGDLSAALSMILTPFIRASLPAAPIFVVSKTRPRSGGSLLQELVGMIATGRPSAVLTGVKDEDEQRKRLLAVLLSGDPIVLLDNVEGDLGGASLCAILSQPTFRDRVLGASRDVEVSTAITFLANGNNIILRGDITARTIPIFLDPQTDRPEETPHETNLYNEIPRRRGELVSAALTILRAYHVAARPDVGLRQWGGGNLSEWSERVRCALVWCGLPDPTAGRLHVEDTDPIRSALSGLLAAWHEAFADRPTTVAAAVAFAEQPGQYDHVKAGTLREALEEVAEEKGRISRRGVGRFLARYAGRIEDGLRFVRGGDRQHAVRWAATEAR